MSGIHRLDSRSRPDGVPDAVPESASRSTTVTVLAEASLLGARSNGVWCAAPAFFGDASFQ